jgi:hypothetical protein
MTSRRKVSSGSPSAQGAAGRGIDGDAVHFAIPREHCQHVDKPLALAKLSAHDLAAVTGKRNTDGAGNRHRPLALDGRAARFGRQTLFGLGGTDDMPAS